MSHHYGKPLAVKVAGGKLTIEIGIHTLAHAVAFADWSNRYTESGDYVRTFAISEPEQFAGDIAHAMEDEREDGSTPLSDFLDKMAEAAIDDGAMGAEYDQHIKHGEFASSEKWAAEAHPAPAAPPQE